jgi:hypothetical protein
MPPLLMLMLLLGHDGRRCREAMKQTNSTAAAAFPPCSCRRGSWTRGRARRRPQCGNFWRRRVRLLLEAVHALVWLPAPLAGRPAYS